MITIVFSIIRCARADFSPDATVPDNGYIYKATWNKSGDYIFVASSGEKVLLTVFGSCDNETIKRAECAEFAVIKCKIRPVKDNDYGRYLMSRGVGFSAYATWDDIEFTENGSSGSGGAFVMRFFAGLRYDIRTSLVEIMGSKYAGVAFAVMTGSDCMMEDNVKDDFSDAGILHVTAVSGMHVAMMMKPVALLSRNRFMGYKARSVFKIIAAVFFMFLTDFSHSVVRAVLMFLYAQSGKIFDRPALLSNGIYFAAIVQMIHNPFVIYSVGFLLSYASVLSICYVEPLLPINGKYISSLRTGIAVNIGLVPLLMYYFGKISLVGIFINSVAGFFSGGICICGYLCGFFGLNVCGYLCAFFTKALSLLARGASNAPPPFGAMNICIENVAVVLGIYVGLIIVVALMWKRRGRRGVAQL